MINVINFILLGWGLNFISSIIITLNIMITLSFSDKVTAASVMMLYEQKFSRIRFLRSNIKSYKKLIVAYSDWLPYWSMYNIVVILWLATRVGVVKAYSDALDRIIDNLEKLYKKERGTL